MAKFGELITKTNPVVILFYADWHDQCVETKKLIQKIASEMNQSSKFISIDVDKNQELADALRIKNIPVLMTYKDGNMMWRRAGEISEQEIVEQFNS